MRACIKTSYARVFDVCKVGNLARINRARILCLVHAVLYGMRGTGKYGWIELTERYENNINLIMTKKKKTNEIIYNSEWKINILS